MGDVGDVLGLCQAVLDSRTRKLYPDDYDDALSHLYEAIVHIWIRFDPALGVPFLAYATGRLRFAFSDWGREWFGRREGAEKPHIGAVRFDDLLGDDGSTDPHGPLGSALAARSRSAPDDRDDAVLELLSTGDRETLREIRSLGLCPSEAATGRD